MKFIKNKPEELNFNEKIMSMIKESEELQGKVHFQYLICHGNLKYLVNLEVDGRHEALDKLGDCDYKTACVSI